MALAVVLFLLVIGSLIFHFASPWYFTPIASNWGLIDLTVDITFWVCGIVFVLITLFTAYCVLKFRHRPGHKAHYEPESHKLEIW
ncbi:MAG: cytochrome-c oxidase, partial [Gammaproteobacteria bacterium]|nr:cytochrome-c oxidase [Gammaproteobacteria bacterium]